MFLGLRFVQVCRPRPAHAVEEKMKNIENKSILSELSSPLIAIYKILQNVMKKGNNSKLYLATTTLLIVLSFAIGAGLSMRYIKDGSSIFKLKYKLRLLEATVRHKNDFLLDKN
jgi:hypothetical protein